VLLACRRTLAEDFTVKKQRSVKRLLNLPEAKKVARPSARHLAQLHEVMLRDPNGNRTEKMYLGRAGEFYVASHLLRLGFNPATLPVDDGVDLLAHRAAEKHNDILTLQTEYHLFQLQIKTTASDQYAASLPIKKVNELWHKTINLIIVFWSKNTSPAAIVIAPSLLRMLTSGGFEDPKAAIALTGKRASLKVFLSGTEFFVRNRKQGITAMHNRFDLIEPIGTDTGRFPEYAFWSDQGGVEFDEEYLRS
jgi:hypothetical protein